MQQNNEKVQFIDKFAGLVKIAKINENTYSVEIPNLSKFNKVGNLEHLKVLGMEVYFRVGEEYKVLFFNTVAFKRCINRIKSML